MTPNQQVLSDEQILRKRDTHVGGPTPSYPLDNSDWLDFARAIESATLAALAQQAQEPVAWLVSLPDEPELGEWFSEQDMSEQGYTSKPLYTTPQPKPAPPVPAPVDERAKFEAFAQNCPMGSYRITRRGDLYDSSHTQIMWDTWQARAALQSTAPQATKGGEA